MSGVTAVADKAGISQQGEASSRLVKATREFEAILLSSWLEKMQESFAGSEDGGDPAHGTLASMGTQAIASALSARGGIGIARMLLQQFGKGAEEHSPQAGGPGAGEDGVAVSGLSLSPACPRLKLSQNQPMVSLHGNLAGE